jgi:hypothetical protein
VHRGRLKSVGRRRECRDAKEREDRGQHNAELPEVDQAASSHYSHGKLLCHIFNPLNQIPISPDEKVSKKMERQFARSIHRIAALKFDICIKDVQRTAEELAAMPLTEGEIHLLCLRLWK